MTLAPETFRSPQLRRSILFLSAVLLSLTANAQQPGQKTPATKETRDEQPLTTAVGKPSSGPIKGRVIGDGGRPVAGASIVAMPVNLGSNLQAAMTSILRPIRSDGDGQFQVTGLSSGAYVLAVNLFGYVLSDTASQVFYRPGDNVTLRLVKGGVITGKVTGTSGEPLVGVVVRAIKIKESDNKPIRMRDDMMRQISGSTAFQRSLLGSFKTDDRGIYRIYGLEAGYYQVAAGGPGPTYVYTRGSGGYEDDAPTYFPSSTIDTASEVIVRAGDEATNIDIRYRANKGHSLSGSILGAKDLDDESAQVFLTRANGIPEATALARPAQKGAGFGFDSVLDGEYFVTAMAGSTSMFNGMEAIKLSVSSPRRVTISGSDVTGIELSLEPLASISGRAVIEPAPADQKAICKTKPVRIEEVVISTKGERISRAEDQTMSLFSSFKNTTPNEKGEFINMLLRPDVRHVEVQLPRESLYVKSITLPPSTPNGKPVDAARSGVKLKPGDKVTGLTVTLAEGAALLSGKVVTGKESNPPREKLRVFLVPAEPEAGDDVLRYSENEMEADGGFVLRSVVPGKYWVVVREISDQEFVDGDHTPLAWDSGGRTSLRFEGEASKKIVELARCQQTTDFVVSYVPLAKPTKPALKLDSRN